MNVFENITGLLGVILWPLLAGAFLVYFRKPLSSIIGSIGRAIEKAEQGSVGVGNFKLNWGKAEEEMIQAAEKTEQGSATKGTGDGSVVTKAVGAARGVLDRITPGAAPAPAPAMPGAGSGSGSGVDFEDLGAEEEDAEEGEMGTPPAPSRHGTDGPAPAAPKPQSPVQTGWKPVHISRSAQESALQRAQRAAPRLAGLRVLWVDDSPQQNAEERRLFRTMQMDVSAVEEHSEALDMLARGDFDIVISDMRRGDDQTAGAGFLEKMRSLGFTQPVIFYIGRLDPSMGVPPYAFGITNRPDELLHYVVEIAERRR